MSIVKLNNRGVKNATAIGSITGLGSMVFIKKLTASSSSTLSFVDGASSVVLDNTYKEYLFTFKNIHPSANGFFGFNASVDSGSNYNVTKTSSAFYAYHAEDDSESGLTYDTGQDLAQSTGRQNISSGQIGVVADDSFNGYLHLFNPSSTTFVKHYIASSSYSQKKPANEQAYIAGYCNTTSAIDAIQFSQSTGNIDAGDICLYGIA